MWRKGNSCAPFVGIKLVQPPWKRVWLLLKNLKIELPYDPAIPLLGIYPKKMKTLIQKDTCIPMFVAALFTIVKIWKQLKCPSTDEEWIKMCTHTQTHTHTHTDTDTQTQIHTQTHTDTHTQTQKHRHTQTQTHTQTHTDTDTDRHRNTHTDTHRDTHRQTHRHRHKDTHRHTHTLEYYSAIKKNKILPLATM